MVILYSVPHIYKRPILCAHFYGAVVQVIYRAHNPWDVDCQQSIDYVLLNCVLLGSFINKCFMVLD